MIPTDSKCYNYDSALRKPYVALPLRNQATCGALHTGRVMEGIALNPVQPAFAGLAARPERIIGCNQTI